MLIYLSICQFIYAVYSRQLVDQVSTSTTMKNNVDKTALRKAKGIVTVEPGLEDPANIEDKITKDLLTTRPQSKEVTHSLSKEVNNNINCNNYNTDNNNNFSSSSSSSSSSKNYNNNHHNNNNTHFSNDSEAENYNVSYKSSSPSSLLKSSEKKKGGFLSRFRSGPYSSKTLNSNNNKDDATTTTSTTPTSSTVTPSFNINHNICSIQQNNSVNNISDDNNNIDYNPFSHRDSSVSDERLNYEANDLRDKIRNKTHELMNVNTLLNNKITLLQENINAQIKLPVTINYNARLKSKHQLHASVLTDEISSLTQDKSALEEMIGNYKDLYKQLTGVTYDDFLQSCAGSSSCSSSNTIGLLGRCRNSLSSKQTVVVHNEDRDQQGRDHHHLNDDKNGHDGRDHHPIISEGNTSTAALHDHIYIYIYIYIYITNLMHSNDSTTGPADALLLPISSSSSSYSTSLLSSASLSQISLILPTS